MRRDWTLFRLLAAGVLAALVITLIYKGPALFGISRPERPRVVLILKMVDFRTFFWRAVRDGAEAAAEDSHINLSIRGPLSETDVDEQIRIFRQALREKPALILLAAADFYGLVPVVKEAVAQGIPVLTLDSFINSEDARCRIGTDNIEAGRKCAEALKRSIAPGATVAVFSYIRGSSTAIDREAGLRQGLGDQFPLLPTRYSNAESAIAYTQAKQLLAEHPGIGGMVALNEPTTLGVARALRESGRARQIPLVGVDNAFMVMKYVEDGTVRDAIVQQPFNMGYLSVVTARQVLDGKRVPRAIDTGSVDIDKTTMFLQQNQKLLFPVNDVVP